MNETAAGDPLRVLIVDDNQAIHEDFKKILLFEQERNTELDELEAALFGSLPLHGPAEVSDRNFRIDSAYRGEQAVEMVRAATSQGAPYCLAFVDVRMPPGLSGIETIPLLWKEDPRLQVVICTAYSDHTWNEIVQSVGYRDSLLVLRKPFDAIEVLQAAHALAKKWVLGLELQQRLADLELAVKHRTASLERTNLELSAQIERRARAEQELRQLATHDPLTGIPNRVLLHERLSAALARARRQSSVVALMLLDLDHFKDVNDTYGHPAGDELLVAFVKRLSECVRTSDTVARMGGDEFAIVLEDIAEPEDAAIVAERLLKACSEPVSVAGTKLHALPSIGVAVFPNDCGDAEGLIKSADVAMYEAKEAGRAQYRYYSRAMLADSREKLMLREQLMLALEREELRVWYQPLFDAKTGRVTAMEALVRWKHPELGMVPPIKFIPAAEKSGLIVAIGAWVLRTACMQIAAWRRLGASNLCIAVNASAREVQSPDFVDLVKNALADAELDPGALELELTESAAMKNPEQSAHVLRQLSGLGVRLAIDDFGAGHSSLLRLRDMPISVLKIDRFFVRDIASSPRDRAIVAAVAGMAQSLGLTVVAEGVETQEQLEALKNLSWDASRTCCDRIQGFLLSKPLPSSEATQFLDEARALRPFKQTG
jgi:diguanylate cyclase (GGDEF)-like protein